MLLCTNTTGCIAYLIITLSGDVEKNPGPFTQISNAIIVHLMRRTRMLYVPNKSIQFHYWNPDYVNLVEFQSMYWEMQTVFFSAVSRQLNNTPEYHFYIHSLRVQHLLHHPGLYFESNVL